MSARIDTAAERARLDGLAGHTPGPWRLHDAEAFEGRATYHYQEVWSDGLDVIAAEVYRAHGDGGRQNMRLIAAAPDLLTSYRAALDEIDRLTAALAEAEDHGAARMRDRAAIDVLKWEGLMTPAGEYVDEDIAADIRALPLREPGAVQPTMRDETGMEHIARDIREGRFPKRSPRQQVPDTPDTPDQPDETLAWGIIRKDGEIIAGGLRSRDVAGNFAGPGEHVVRVAIRIVEEEA